MDPGRRAMISGSSGAQRDITSPRRDPNTRVSKPARPAPAKTGSGYMTQDEQARQFIANEDKFVLKQSKKKADIRVRERRAKPIDLLAFNLRFIDEDRDADFDDDADDAAITVPGPADVIAAIKEEAQLKELESDITHYHTLESNARNLEYWRSLRVLCTDRRDALRPSAERRVTQSVDEGVDRLFQSKTLDQLKQLEKQIRGKLQSNEDIDVDYWEELLRKIPVYMANATIKARHEEIRRKRLDLLRASDPELAAAFERQEVSQRSGASSERPAAAAPTVVAPADPPSREPEASASTPRPSQSSDAPPGTTRFALAGSDDFSQATKALYEREVARGIGENEEIFTAEEAVPSGAKPQWADKYRPRKPRYFNRVQMGYEWNKYNQTHYDHDNPPPKVVHGYKFNIFYPDLIDKTKTPEYKIIREHGRRRGQSFAAAGEEDTCLIRFIAGPPYEDIAFRIVDREWDYSAKKDGGFKAEFKKGILQLHFQFKKIYYRK